MRRSDNLPALTAPLVVDSNTDFVTNILLTIPLGYLALAALITDRPGRLLRFTATLLTLVSCFALSMLAEFAQVFFQGRTDSLSDIVAQCGGAVVGVSLCLLASDQVTAWLRESLEERATVALVERLLLAYCVLFAITQLMPLDLTISLGQLAAKYRRGMIILRPFAYAHASSFDMWWDYLGNVVINAPIGAAAVLLWTRGNSRRRPWFALALGSLAVGLIEFSQVFVSSRLADSTDLLTGSIGVALGVTVATLLAERDIASSSTVQDARLSRFATLASAAWIAV